MKKLAIGLLAFLALAGQAMAADMLVKTPRQGNFLIYPYNGSGWYWGIDVEAGVAQSSVSGASPLFATSLVNGGLTASGGAVGGTVGYMSSISGGTKWIASEVTVDYMNISGSAPVAGANVNIASRFSVEADFKVGGLDLSWLPSFGITFPTLPSPPLLPGIAITGTAHPYLMVGVRGFSVQADFGQTISNNNQWGVAPVVGAGVLNQMVDSKGQLSGSVLDTGAKVVFAGRGFTLNNIGGNFSTGGAANLGTQYLAYAKVLF